MLPHDTAGVEKRTRGERRKNCEYILACLMQRRNLATQVENSRTGRKVKVQSSQANIYQAKKAKGKSNPATQPALDPCLSVARCSVRQLPESFACIIIQ